MNKVVITSAILLSLAIEACAAPPPAPTPFPTLPPLPPTLPLPTPTSTTQPTATTQPTFTATATQVTSSLRLTPTPSRPAASPGISTATASPTISTAGFPPGIYVTDVRTDPNPPNRTAELKFHATFVNTLGAPQNYRWIVYIYRTDAPGRSTGETTSTPIAIPTGTSEQKSDGFWKLGPGNQCEYFFARVAWLDQDKKPTLFTRPDGKVFEKNLTLCP